MREHLNKNEVDRTNFENIITHTHIPEEPEHVHVDESEHRDSSSSHGNGNGISIGGNNSAFNRVQRITFPTDDINDLEQRIAPGVERISAEGETSQRETDLEPESQGVQRTTSFPIEPRSYQEHYRSLFGRELPLAYPVDSNTTTLTTVTTTTQEPIDEPSDQNDNIVEEIALSNSNNVNKMKGKKLTVCIIVSFITLNALALVLISILTQLPSRDEEIIKTDKNLNETLISYNHTNVNIINSTYDNSSIISHQSNQNNHSLATCVTDPRLIQNLEWEAYERGEDPSIPRTYHFCPNSIMNVYNYDTTWFKFIFTTGDTHPLVIFRSNMNILCGFDGDYSNNCTFNGGFTHITIRPRPIQLSYDIGTDVENVTIKGFRFTGASNGMNILLRPKRTSAIIKNCHFDNNYNMTASLFSHRNNSEASTAHVQNCTFENNSFSYNTATTPIQRKSTHVQASGAILMYNSIRNPDAIVKLFVTNCVFQNNTFFIDPDTSDFVSSAVVNLFDPETKLEITDSCFIDNRGYSSALILLGSSSSFSDDVLKEEGNMNNASHHIYYSSNSFYDNVASDLYKESCILNSRSIDLMVEPGEPFKQNVKESCDEYFESEEESNDTSSIRYATCSLHDVDLLV